MRKIFMSVIVLFYMSAGLYAQESYSGTTEEIQEGLQSSSQSIANASKAAILIAGTIAPFVASVVTYEATRDVGLALVAVGAGVIFDMAAYQGIMIGYELSKLEKNVSNTDTSANASN